ncbi:MAG: hypothetical protein ACYTHN_14660, partial [Planctomycetota bacterium]
ETAGPGAGERVKATKTASVSKAGEEEEPFDCSTPGATVTAYLEQTYGFEEASHMELFTRKAREEMVRAGESFSFKILEETVDGDQATVKTLYTFPLSPQDQEMIFILKREEGGWKIAKLGTVGMMIDYENIQGMADEIRKEWSETQARIVETELEPQKEDEVEIEEKLERDVFENEKKIDLDEPPIEDAAPRTCVSNLRRLFVALYKYKREKGRSTQFPMFARERFVVQLVLDKILEDPKVLLCPATKHTNSGVDMLKAPEKATDYTALDNRKGSTINIGTLYAQNVPVTRIPLVWDKKGNHPGVRHVLFLDGHIETLKEEEFQKRFGKYE